VQETLGEGFLAVPEAIQDRLINKKKRRFRRPHNQNKAQLEALQASKPKANTHTDQQTT
jgi:hypothetical protein